MSAPDRRLAAALMINAAVIMTTVQDSLIKLMSTAYPFHQMQTARCFVGMLVVIVFMAATTGFGNVFPPGWPWLIVRGLIFGVASLLFYLTAAAMPFAEAVSLYFTMPLFVAGLVWPMLGEPVPWHRWLSISLGFLGVLIIVNPGAGVLEPAALLGLTAAVSYAVGNIMTRPFAAEVTPATLTLHMSVMYLVVAGGLSLVFGWGTLHTDAHVSLDYLTRGWVPLQTGDLLFLGGIGLSTGTLYLLLTAAYRIAPTSYVAPFEYVAMFWAVLASYIVFGDVPTLQALVGMALVAGSGLFMFLFETRAARAVRS